MKKFLYSIFALLLLAGVSTAASIPPGVDPDNGGPEIWTTSVYNNSSSTVNAGDVVIWDIDQSTGTNDNWINTTTTANTHIVAGVVYPAAIASKDVGTIAIRGPVSVNYVNASQGLLADGDVCAAGTAGKAQSCPGGSEQYKFGSVVGAASGSAGLVYVNP